VNTSAIIEGLKETGRVAVIAALPLIISGIEAGNLDWRLVAITGAIAALKGLDKFVHKNDNINANGVLPF